MSMEMKLLKAQEVQLLKNNYEGLNEVYKDMALEIGIEKTLIIYKMFHGTQVSFPNQLFTKEYLHRMILEEYNGNNASELAKKFNYSERSIWRIIRSKS